MEVNYLAVLVAGVAGFIIGFLWYMPRLFGKAWMRAVGITNADTQNKDGLGKKMLIALITVFVTAYVLAQIVNAFYIATGNLTGTADPIKIGVTTGFWIWLGFLATSFVDPVLWENKPWKLWLINAGQWLVRLLVMGAIIGAWR